MRVWRAAVARVFAGDPRDAAAEFRGTAFLVGPKQLLSCRHVVDIDATLFVSGPPWTGTQKIIRRNFHDSRDIAVLAVANDLDRVASSLMPWVEDSGVDISDLTITLGGYST